MTGQQIMVKNRGRHLSWTRMPCKPSPRKRDRRRHWKRKRDSGKYGNITYSYLPPSIEEKDAQSVYLASPYKNLGTWHLRKDVERKDVRNIRTGKER